MLRGNHYKWRDIRSEVAMEENVYMSVDLLHKELGLQFSLMGFKQVAVTRWDNTRRKESFFYRDTDISTIFHPWDSHMFTHWHLMSWIWSTKFTFLNIHFYDCNNRFKHSPHLTFFLNPRCFSTKNPSNKLFFLNSFWYLNLEFLHPYVSRYCKMLPCI